jgi:hypothetical protein
MKRCVGLTLHQTVGTLDVRKIYLNEIKILNSQKCQNSGNSQSGTRADHTWGRLFCLTFTFVAACGSFV